MAAYQEQVTPFFDFSRADFRYNSEGLAPVTLPELIGVLEKLPVAASLQREDFRARLAADSGVTMAELVYSVVMALDSVKITADIKLGGLDQLLNMQMCRRVIENAGQQSEIIIATGLIEGTDGTGAKMSKCEGNYIGLASGPKDVFGKLMSAADRLLPAYLRALTELLDPEIDLLLQLMADRKVHPMGIKTPLACDVTAAVALRQRRFRAVAGVEECLHDRLLGRRRHAMRTLAHKPVLTDLAAVTGGVLHASPATVAGLGFQPSFKKERGQRERRGRHPGPSGGERPPAQPGFDIGEHRRCYPGDDAKPPEPRLARGGLEQDHRADDNQPVHAERHQPGDHSRLVERHREIIDVGVADDPGDRGDHDEREPGRQPRPPRSEPGGHR
jgi:hypothetical protein